MTDEELRQLVADLSKTINAIVIVPSHKRAAFWKPVANQILDAASLETGVAQLRSGKHVGVTVLVNKYDGIDLPGDACRLLVVDGLPDVYGLTERVEFTALDGTELQLVRQVRRIEQAMGRGVRSSDDFCVVLLSGRRLTERLNMPAAQKRFSSATQAQLALGESVAAQLKGQPHETAIPAGFSVLAATQSAMFDELCIDKAADFHIGRPAWNYMHWGSGLHTCFGQYINQVQIPEILKPLLQRKNLRRADGDAGMLQYEGPFPSSLKVRFD